jgi:hypothetical protein
MSQGSSAGCRKIFCIGSNKTGTTSLAAALIALGFKLGDQGKAEALLEDWARRNFLSILRYCETADAFQDLPFSLPYTFQALDQAFPQSKFILTIRASPEEWFNSLIRFHSAAFDGRLPTAEELKLVPYREPGWIWRAHQLTYGCDENSVYHKPTLIGLYERHNANVIDYFRHRPRDLLVLNLSQPDAMAKLCAFLDVTPSGAPMPHLNSRSEVTAHFNRQKPSA